MLGLFLRKSRASLHGDANPVCYRHMFGLMEKRQPTWTHPYAQGKDRSKNVDWGVPRTGSAKAELGRDEPDFVS